MMFQALFHKELSTLKHNRAFTVIGLLSPLIGYFIFFLLLGSDITFTLPVVDPHGEITPYLEEAKNPAGTPYLDQAPMDKQTAAESLEDYSIPAYAEVTDYGVNLVFGRLDVNLVKNLVNRVNHAILNYTEDHRTAPQILINEHNTYPLDIDWLTYMTPGLYVYGLMLAGSILGATLITYEFETKGIKMLSLSPKNLTPVYLAKGLAGFALAFTAGLLFLLIARLTSGFTPLYPSLWFLASAIIIILALTMGMAVGLLIRSSIPAFLLLLVLNLSMWVIGGGFGKISLFSEALQTIAKVTPAYYGMNLIRFATFGDQGLGRLPVQALGLGLSLALFLAAVIFLNRLRFRKPA